MASNVTTARIRNVALVGHSGAGTTTLAEALLARSGALARPGRVDDGTSALDVEPEAVKRRQSLSLAWAPVDWAGHRINLLDTPGYADFAGEVRAALAVADLVVVVVSAVDGVQVQTEAAWNLAADLGLPRLVFVNKLDRERADFSRTLDDLRATFGAGIAPLELPIGTEAGFRGVVDLLSDQAFVYDGGTRSEVAMPDDLAATEHEVHDALVEGIVVADDALLERFLDGDVPTAAELEHVLAGGVARGQVVPVVCGSATSLVGVDRLADLICEIGPEPTQRPVVVTTPTGDLTVTADAAAPPLMQVFATVTDPYVGQLSFARVLTGTIHTDDRLVNPRTGGEERLHSLLSVRGKTQTPVDTVVAGDLVAIAKLSGTATGDTLAPRGTPVTVPGWDPEPAVLAVGIVARTQADDDKLGSALHRIGDEDRSIRVERNDETHQTLLWGTGEAHLAVTIERLARKFGVKVDTEPVRIAHRETLAAPVTVEGRHKKQSGGHGQFGVVTVTFTPLPRGAGFEFVDRVVGGAVPRALIPAVAKGIEDAMAHGGLHGFPVVDLRAELIDGKHHAVDSSEMAFRTAGSLALREALSVGGTVVLEPISRLDVTVPSGLQGDILGDLNARRGRVVSAEAIDERTHHIVAHVPTSEVVRYAVDLRSMTGGRGRFTSAHDHHDALPAPLVERLPRTPMEAHA